MSEDFAWPAYNVEAVSIDEYLNLERCTIGIKVDVEGHEYEVLCGMAETLKRNKVFMQVEVFEVNAKRTLPAIEALGVREIKQIYPDRYYTNMTVEELGA